MDFSNIKSARYADPIPTGGAYPPDAKVISVSKSDVETTRRANDDIEGGGMLSFLRNGGTIAPYVPPVVDVAAYRVKAHETAMAYGNAITAKEIGGWAGVEPLSWGQQREEAKTVLDQGADALPEDALLVNLALDKGVTLLAYAEDVWANAQRYEQILRAAIQLRRLASTILDPTLDTVAKVDAKVAELKGVADQLAAQLIGG